jgi:hypothetical protein
VLAADGPDDAVLDRVVPECGQRPAAVRQANHGGRLLGEQTEGGPLVGSDPQRRSTPRAAAHPSESLTVEGMQVSLDGMGMQGKEARDGRGVPALGEEHQRLRAAQLPAVRSCLQKLTQLPQFSGGGATAGQRAGHGRTSTAMAIPAFYQGLGDKFSHTLGDATLKLAPFVCPTGAR